MKSVIWTYFITLILLSSVIILAFLFPVKWSFVSRRSHSALEKASQECKQLSKKEGKPKVNWDHLYYYEDRQTKKNVIWCKVPKAGSTTITKIFLRTAGARNLQDETKIHRLLRIFFPRLTKGVMMRRLKTSFKFVVVRDPFERILSAYRDKLENSKQNFRYEYYYNNYGKHMIVPPVKNGTVQEPTWQEFVNYLVTTPIGKFDEHWMPIHRLCSPCSIQYDSIVKLENFNEEILLPLRKGGIYSQIGWAHKMGTYDDRIVKKYFQNITYHDVQKLYKVYKKDFTLFGYSPLKYFHLANGTNVSIHKY